MKTLTRAASILLPFALIVPVSAPVHAQQAAPTSIAAVCMTRPGNKPGSPTFVSLVPLSGQAGMADKGFAVRLCKFDPGGFAVYRAKVCHLANDAPTLVQSQFEQQYNITPRALCDMANTLAGA